MKTATILQKKVGPVQVRTRSDPKVRSTSDLDLNLKNWVRFTSHWPGPSNLWVRSGPDPGPRGPGPNPGQSTRTLNCLTLQARATDSQTQWLTKGRTRAWVQTMILATMIQTTSWISSFLRSGGSSLSTLLPKHPTRKAVAPLRTAN
jgi:hypothetical protein